MIERRFRTAVGIGATIWCLLIVAAPLLRSPALYLLFSRICHQQTARSWHIFGEPFAACIRCTSIYLGFLFGALLKAHPNSKRLETALGITAAEFIIARLLLDSPWLRAPSGILLGFEAAPFVVLGIQQMVAARFRHAAV